MSQNMPYKKKQEELGLSVSSLLQYCKTRWNSIFLMLDRLVKNRNAVMSVLIDHNITSTTIAKKLEISASEWIDMENLTKVLEPFQMATLVICSEDACISMVLPILDRLLKDHMTHDDEDSHLIETFKLNLKNIIRERFKLDYDSEGLVSMRQIASLLDPRYKDLDHEFYDSKVAIRNTAKELSERIAPIECVGEKEVVKKKTALEFLYKKHDNSTSNIKNQWEAYFAEPQLKFDLDPYEWWKFKKDKYPSIALLARRYLCIPATSVSSERCFSTAGNIVTKKRASLLPENVNLLVFLYQNRKLLKEDVSHKHYKQS